MMLSIFLLISSVYAADLYCDNLPHLIEQNAVKFGTSGAFNSTNYPDALKDLVAVHIPSYTLDGPKGTAVMLQHPQTKDHYITDLWVYDDKSRLVHCRKFYPEEKAETSFLVTHDTAYLRVYEHCNLHGVWEAPPLNIRCNNLEQLIRDNEKLGKKGVFNTKNYPDAFKGLVGLHIPAVNITRDPLSGFATLANHPMVDSHHITDMWVFDRYYNQLACTSLHPNEKASFRFHIPSYVREVIVLEHCNLHGVWETDPIPVKTSPQL